MQDKIKTIPEELNDKNLIPLIFEIGIKNNANKVKIKIEKIDVSSINKEIKCI